MITDSKIWETVNTLGDTKETRWSVYRHTSPSGKVYVGITGRSPHARWGNTGEAYKNCKVFYKAVKKYGWGNIKHEVLFSKLTEEQAKHLEIEFIRHYKELGISYNVTDGGDGALGRKTSEETRAKQRKVKLGRPLSEEHLAKIREAGIKRRGVEKSEEFKQKLREANKGKKPSPQTIAALKEYLKNHPISEERREILRQKFSEMGRKYGRLTLEKNRETIGKKHRKAVVQLTIDGSFVAEYEAIKFATISTGTDGSTITACCKGKQHKAGGCLWMYKDLYEEHTANGTLVEFTKSLIEKANQKPGQYERTEEWRRRKSESEKGIDKRSESTKAFMTKRAKEVISKPVMQLSLDNTFIDVFPSCVAASRQMKCSDSTICACCNGKREKALGYKWKYITQEEYEMLKNKPFNNAI